MVRMDACSSARLEGERGSGRRGCGGGRRPRRRRGWRDLPDRHRHLDVGLAVALPEAEKVENGVVVRLLDVKVEADLGKGLVREALAQVGDVLAGGEELVDGRAL